MSSKLNYNVWLDRVRYISQIPVFFVLGCQKSGTTWVQRLLDAHPNIRCSGEGHFVDILLPCFQQALKAYNKRQVQRAGDNLSVITSDFDLLYTTRVLASSILANYLNSTENPLNIHSIGDKTPESAIYLEPLACMFDTAKMIHVIRDGRDGAVSGWAHLSRKQSESTVAASGKFGTFADYAEYFAQNHWSQYINSARRIGKKIPDRYLEVRYESLHENPEHETERILTFLGMSADEHTVKSCVQAASFEQLTGGRKRGEEDPSSIFRKGVTGEWQLKFDENAKKRFEKHAGQLLRELGYESLPVSQQLLKAD